jgi:hypothetical protein
MQTTVIASKTPGAKPALLSGNRRLGAEPNGQMPHRTDHRHPSAASLPSERRDLLAMGAAKQGKKQANSTQITQIKPKITQKVIEYVSGGIASISCTNCHVIFSGVIFGLICVICVDLACFLPNPARPVKSN